MNEIKKSAQEKLSNIDDYFEISVLIDFIFTNSLNLFVWQHQKAHEKRVFHFGRISKLDKMENLLKIVPSKTEQFKFEVKSPLYLFSEDKAVAWKCRIKRFEAGLVTCEYPLKIARVERDYIKKLQFIEMEDEEKFLKMRSTPRANANEGQMITLERFKSGKMVTQFLYDLSQGGMAFLVEDPGEYEVGEKLRLFGLDGVELEKKIDGEVVAIRKKEEALGDYKICIKFLESW